MSFIWGLPLAHTDIEFGFHIAKYLEGSNSFDISEFKFFGDVANGFPLASNTTCGHGTIDEVKKEGEARKRDIVKCEGSFGKKSFRSDIVFGCLTNRSLK